MNKKQKITAPTKDKQEQSIKAEKIILLIDGKPIYHQENHD